MIIEEEGCRGHKIQPRLKIIRKAIRLTGCEIHRKHPAFGTESRYAFLSRIIPSNPLRRYHPPCIFKFMKMLSERL